MQGTIIKSLSGFYYIEHQGEVYQTRGRGNFRKRKITPLVGDYCEFESTSITDGYLLEILPRKNELIRPPVANVDIGVVVISAVEPKFSSNLLDRFLVILESKSIQPIIYISKTDLVTNQADMIVMQKEYQKIGYQVCLDYSELEAIKSEFTDKITVFIGQTGAGKSTLINQIDEQLNLATGAISKHLGRGKHTTRHVELHEVLGGLIADTPGFSSIDLREIEANQLAGYFIEISEYGRLCKFRACTHTHEPDCAVKKAVEHQEIATFRYENYLQLLNEIEQRKPVYNKRK
ncbi:MULTISPECIES: ribosome small subunit-dependent GTPase A [unclassified Enterococcus]|uniref:ribosome small subunit-dependent GTPase A n=1 Tax=unclassified Enterococcus TaxID=2608891 RepID=UPI0015552BA7|nr:MULTISPECIES: ribosome small subunit-dependent GTPase A [unclassified Enterococcus]MBS7576022.1 ribosome small subunit-dependent GTPase A [Enterococcus sp. MMGLQ5-2]MBS7583255.1 ribosome small subunit-dependent GTPase A [Enterococcus sp. MMGLQ5-1]NPD11115.1 ribosome small subunit-dependent GTPase A [Enterococcus sp. MMGLQ5-1]NPD35858.1 ribosome small subunit-dependent GTPase A [Enterococcus sp. MMGLQ5-2]